MADRVMYRAGNPSTLAADVGVLIRKLPGGYLSAEIPDEGASLGLILITPEPCQNENEPRHMIWHVRISDELFAESPECVTAAMQLAFLELRHLRGAIR